MHIDLGVFFRKYWAVVAQAGVVAALVALGATFVLSPRYEATVRILVTPRDDAVAAGVAVNAKQLYARTQGDLVLGNDVLERTVSKLGLDKTRSPGGIGPWIGRAVGTTLVMLKHGFVATQSPFDAAVASVREAAETVVLEDSNVFEIRVSWTDPKVAASVADELARQYVAVSAGKRAEQVERVTGEVADEIGHREDALRQASRDLQAFRDERGLSADDGGGGLSSADAAELVVLEKRLATAESDLMYWRDVAQSVRSESITGAEEVRVLGAAGVPAYPDGPLKILYAGVGLLVGVLVGLSVALVAELRSTSVYSADDIRRATGSRVPTVVVEAEEERGSA